MNGIYDALAVPFGYIMHLLFELFDNYHIALFMLTLVVKLFLLPSSISQQKGTAKQTRLQPKINRIRQKYAGNGQPTRELQMKIQEETQALYQREGFSPMSGGCLPLLIQFPIMIGLYGVVKSPFSRVLQIPATVVKQAAQSLGIDVTSSNNDYELKLLRDLTQSNMPDCLSSESEAILSLKNQFIFGNLDLTGTPKWTEPSALWLIPGIVLLLGLITSFIMFKKQKQNNPEMASNPTMGCMTFFSPLMSVVFTFMFPASVGVYWILSSFFSLIQIVVLNKLYSPQKVIAQLMIDETVERRSREASIKKLKEFSDKEN